MKLKYKGKVLEVSNSFIHDCGMHAVQRGMTLEEYIAEAFTMLEDRPVVVQNGKND
jgi:predicted heme/steroid binding protein